MHDASSGFGQVEEVLVFCGWKNWKEKVQGEGEVTQKVMVKNVKTKTDM